MTHFIDIIDHSPQWLSHVLEVSRQLRQERRSAGGSPVLTGQTLAMLFEKPSLRTRVSFEQAMYELGGHAIVLDQREVGMGQRESVPDIARVLSGMVHGVMARVAGHAKLRELALYAGIPVINALSDDSHPCQALADIFTMQDEFGADLSGRTLAFIGDGNNVALSLAELCAKLGVRFVLAAPHGYVLRDKAVEAIRRDCPKAQVTISNDPFKAVAEADVIYTDTFVSMGQEEEKNERLKAFEGFQVNDELIAAAPAQVIVMHCLPAYRGVEISDAAMDGPRSRVFPQAHNRLHVQKGLLAVLMGGR
jgi:ornithine carbamoyltransferase